MKLQWGLSGQRRTASGPYRNRQLVSVNIPGQDVFCQAIKKDNEAKLTRAYVFTGGRQRLQAGVANINDATDSTNLGADLIAL